MNTQGRGILSHLLEKISRPAACIFPASAEHPFAALRARVSTSEQTSNSDYTH